MNIGPDMSSYLGLMGRQADLFVAVTWNQFKSREDIIKQLEAEAEKKIRFEINWATNLDLII